MTEIQTFDDQVWSIKAWFEAKFKTQIPEKPLRHLIRAIRDGRVPDAAGFMTSDAPIGGRKGKDAVLPYQLWLRKGYATQIRAEELSELVDYINEKLECIFTGRSVMAEAQQI